MVVRKSGCNSVIGKPVIAAIFDRRFLGITSHLETAPLVMLSDFANAAAEPTALIAFFNPMSMGAIYSHGLQNVN